MTLVLTLAGVDRLENGESTQLRLDRHGAVIGRSPHADWSLPDAKSYVSSTHCEIDYRDGAYVLIDKSTNGTFVNGATQRLGAPHVLRDGDVIAIGQYKASVSGAGAAGASAAAGTAPPSPSGAAGAAGWGGWGAKPDAPNPAPSADWASAAAASPAPPAAASAWGSDPAPAPPAPAPGWGAAPAAAAPSDGWGAPAAPSPPGGWSAPATPAASEGWGAPTGPASGGWKDADGSAASLAAPVPASPASGWSGDASAWGAAGAGPARPAASGWDALGPARDAQDRAERDAVGAPAAPVSGRGGLAQNWSPPRVDAPAAPAPPPASVDVWGAMAASNAVDWSRGGFGAAAAPPPPAPAATEDAWAALLAAAGVAADQVRTPPLEAAAAAGAMLKRLVAGLVVMIEARARAKAQLGAQSTTLELGGNNPLKFTRSPEKVLQQLLNRPERGFMGADAAVEDSFRDLQAHQMATLAAMQGALRATLDRFSPEAIRGRAEMRGVLARILPSARNATLWEAYEREFEGVAKGSDEAFMDVFAKAFKAAYEETAAQMKSQAR